MTWKPTKRLKDPELLSEKRFYRLLSEQSNYIDPDMASLFYAGLVRVVASELRTNKMARLPHLGDFCLVKQKARLGWAGNLRTMIPEMEILKFHPSEKLRRYFNKKQELLRFGGVTPPKPIE